jgi:asparagine synthase (glutamine-hydrolysing)
MMITCGEFLAVSGRTAEPPFGADSAEVPFPGGSVWATGEPVAGTGIALSMGPRDHLKGALTSDDLAGRLRSGEGLGDVAAPYAAVLIEGDTVTAATDYLGLRHIYGVRGDGWAAISTSARLLARIADTPLDRDALGAYRLIGHHLGAATPYSGVAKLPAAHRWTLTGGRLRETPYPLPVTEPAADPVRDTARTLRDDMERCLDEHPDAVLQLSGGLDSRVLLAAVPAGRRRGLRALTLSSSESRDDAIATRLAEAYGLRRDVLDLGGLAGLDPAEAYDLVHRAALRSDGLGNPIAFAVLDWAEARAPEGPRINGFGGETARAFYYPAQRQHPRPTPALVDRLARWRVFTLEPADPAMFDPEYAAETEAATLAALHSAFAAYDTDWLSATDEFYVRERAHRWVGATLTVACLRYVTLGPLLHPAFLAVARSLDPEEKRGSRFNARVLLDLDADLARVPLDTGIRPATLPTRGPLRSSSDFARRAARKARQRVRRSGNPGVGVPTVTGLLVRHWRSNPDLLEPVAATGLVREQWLEEMLSGARRPSEATAAFLAILEVAARH